MANRYKHDDFNVDKWLTLEQVAEYLQISTSSIYKMAQVGRIPACKVGRQWRFKRQQIDRWVQGNRPKKVKK